MDNISVVDVRDVGWTENIEPLWYIGIPGQTGSKVPGGTGKKCDGKQVKSLHSKYFFPFDE